MTHLAFNWINNQSRWVRTVQFDASPLVTSALHIANIVGAIHLALTNTKITHKANGAPVAFLGGTKEATPLSYAAHFSHVIVCDLFFAM